jgi:competence protein ComEA
MNAHGGTFASRIRSKARQMAIGAPILFAAFMVSPPGGLAQAPEAQNQQPESQREQAQQPAFPSLPDGPGRDTLIRICGSCHSPDNVTLHGQSREDWQATLAKMAGYGMSASDEDLNEILDYLAKNFPKPPLAKINVNKATPVELELGLRISSKEAKALVEYRTKNGNFKSLDDLRKVPGIDAKKIAENKDRLVY